MKKLFLLAWLMMLSIVAVAQNEKVGNDLVIKNGAGTVVDLIYATENTEIKFDTKGNKLSIKQDGGTKDIALDQVKTISAVPAFKLVAQDKFVYTSTAPITLHFKLTGNNHGEMKPVSGETVTISAGKGKLASTKVTTNDDGVATVEYTPEQSLWEPGFDDVIKALYTFTDSQGRVSRYIDKTYVEYNGDYTIECLSPDQKLGPNEEAEAIFAVYEVSPSGKKPYTGAAIEFSAPEGFITTQSPTTDAFGMARVTFHNDGDDAKEYPVTARFWVRNDNGGLYTGTATAKFITLNYQLEALTPKLAVRNDGSEQDCFFTLYEYHNGKWNVSEKEAEAKFEATGVTLTKTSDMNRGYGFITNFTVGKSFSQGSVTAKCDIQLESGKVWQGVATTELVADDYQFTRISPDGGNPAYVYAEESEDVVFLLTKLVNGQYQFCPGMEVRFECQEGGTLSRTLVKTDADGLATTSFQLNKDEENATVYVNCSFADEHGIWHVYEEDVEFVMAPYKLEAVTPKLAVKNDGSEQSCYFNLFEYKNGKWEEYKEEVEVDFKADGVTLSETSYMYKGYGARAPFTAGKSFKEGSVTAECDIELDNGHIWHGVATTELVLDNYQFSRVLPEDSPAGIYPDESQDVVFQLSKLVNGTYQPCQGEEVIFSSPEGTLTSMLELTDAEGKAATSFQLKKDRPNPFVSARCRFTDELGIRHEYSEIVDFFMTPYKLEAVTPKLAVRNDGSDQRCEFALYEYKDDKWEKCKKEVEVKFEAIGVTLSETSYMNRGYGVEAHFTAGKSFKEGSITAKCDIELQSGKVWHGVATTELIADDYQFSRVLPKDSPAGIYPDESQDVVFSLTKLVNGTYQPCQGKEVIFSSPEGTFTSMLEVTDAEGKAATSFEIKKDMRNAFAHATCRFTDEQGVYHFYSENVDFILIPYRLKCLTPEVEMKKSDGTATIRYELLEYKEGEWVACHDKKLLFTATNGSAQPDYALTNQSGICQTVFTPTEDATEGTVTGTCTIVVNEKANFVWTQSQTAHITIIDDGTGDRPSKEKAKPKIRILDEGSGGTKPKVVDDNGNGEIVFVVEERIEGEDADRPVEGAKVEFETDNQDDNLEGFSWATTDNSGKASAKFKVKNFAKFKGVKIKAKATVKYSDGEKVVETTAKVNSDGTLDTGGGGGDDPCGGGISDSDLKKAYELEQNTFKIGGKVTKLDGPEDMIEWSVTENNEGQKFNSVNWFKEDPVYYTTAWGTIYGFPDDMYGEEIYWSEGSGMSISFGAFIDPSAGYSETNVVDFNSENIQKAVFRLCKDANGNIFAIAYVRSKDGNEGTFKVKAKPAADENTPCDTGDELLNKADQQDNSVVVKNKTTGATEIRDFDLYKCEFNWTTDNLSFTATITGSDGRMDGELGGFIPRGMVGVANPLTSETFENSPGAKVMFYLQQGSTYIDGEFAKFSGEEAFGNLKPESKIMIRKPCNTIQPANARARRTPGDEEYTDEYEVLIYLVFQNQEWNNETQKMEPGDEYEIYGKCTMVMHTPKVTRFQVRPEKDWVKVGESMKVNLESFAEEGATWDWNDVELVSQSANYNDAYNGADDGFFTWDPATQTVTSLKSNDNKYVWVYFGLKSNPSVRGSIQIATGEGWKYTMIKPSVDEITDHPNSYLSFSFDFAPRDSEEEKIDFNALEIDPATNPDGYFSLQKTYGPQGWPIFVSSKAQPGEYNIRFWIKSNHDVNCTLKVIITPENE